MSASTPQPFSSAPANALPVVGLHLATRRTVSFKPKAHSLLRITQGRVWVTSGGRQGLAGQASSGDVVLHAGDELAVPAGAHLVMESWPVRPGDSVRYDWSTCAAEQATAAPRFQREVARPARDLGHELLAAASALGRAAWAFDRVLRGLAGYGECLVAGRGRVLPPLEDGPP